MRALLRLVMSSDLHWHHEAFSLYCTRDDCCKTVDGTNCG